MAARLDATPAPASRDKVPGLPVTSENQAPRRREWRRPDTRGARFCTDRRAIPHGGGRHRTRSGSCRRPLGTHARRVHSQWAVTRIGRDCQSDPQAAGSIIAIRPRYHRGPAPWFASCYALRPAGRGARRPRRGTRPGLGGPVHPRRVACRSLTHSAIAGHRRQFRTKMTVRYSGGLGPGGRPAPDEVGPALPGMLLRSHGLLLSVCRPDER